MYVRSKVGVFLILPIVISVFTYCLLLTWDRELYMAEFNWDHVDAQLRWLFRSYVGITVIVGDVTIVETGFTAIDSIIIPKYTEILLGEGAIIKIGPTFPKLDFYDQRRIISTAMTILSIIGTMSALFLAPGKRVSSIIKKNHRRKHLTSV